MMVMPFCNIILLVYIQNRKISEPQARKFTSPFTFSLSPLPSLRYRRENAIRRLIIKSKIDHLAELFARVGGAEADAQAALVDVADDALGEICGVGYLKRKSRVAEIAKRVIMLFFCF